MYGLFAYALSRRGARALLKWRHKGRSATSVLPLSTQIDCALARRTASATLVALPSRHSHSAAWSNAWLTRTCSFVRYIELVSVSTSTPNPYLSNPGGVLHTARCSLKTRQCVFANRRTVVRFLHFQMQKLAPKTAPG